METAGVSWNLGHEDLKLVLGRRELSSGESIYYPINDNFREVFYDFSLKKQSEIPSRNKEAMDKRHIRLRERGTIKLNKEKVKLDRLLQREKKRKNSKRKSKTKKNGSKRDRLGDSKKSKNNKPRKTKKRGIGKSAIQHDIKNKLLELELMEFPDEFEAKNDHDEHDEEDEEKINDHNGDAMEIDQDEDEESNDDNEASLLRLPRPSVANTFVGTSFYGHNDNEHKLMSLFNSLAMFSGHLLEVAVLGGPRMFDPRILFPPNITPTQLAMSMENTSPSFTTTWAQTLYRNEPHGGGVSPYDRIMVTLVRGGWRDLLHRLSELDKKNPLNNSREDRQLLRNNWCTQKSMYWFSDGPEAINDLSWPEYARRLLVAYDLEREGRDSKDGKYKYKIANAVPQNVVCNYQLCHYILDCNYR